VEHVERQEEREAEIKSDVDDLERQGDELEERGERLEKQVDEVRDEVERKKGSADAPGLQPEEGHSLGSPPGDAAGGAPRTEEDE
jgi:hypothetical protein